MHYKFKILDSDAYESMDHSDLTFKAGWNDILECSPLFYGSMKQVFGSKNYERNCKLCWVLWQVLYMQILPW